MADDSSNHDDDGEDLSPEQIEATIGLARHCSFVATGGIIAAAVLVAGGDPSHDASVGPAIAIVAFAVAAIAAMLTHGYAANFGQLMPLPPHPSLSSTLKTSCAALAVGVVALCLYALAASG